MARPAKPRRICMMPPCTSFVPADTADASAHAPVVMTLDEYECLRLIDYEGADQAACAASKSRAAATRPARPHARTAAALRACATDVLGFSRRKGANTP